MSFRNIRDDGILQVATAADRLALLPSDGTIVEQIDNHTLYIYDANTATWNAVGAAAGADAFGVIQTDTGTSPTADAPSDILTLTTADPTKYFFQGNATTDTVTLNAPGLLPTSTFEEYNLLQKEPTGFPNRTDSTLSINISTRTFTIQPTTTSYDVYVKGTKFTKTTSQSTAWPNLPGAHYFYFDISGNLQTTQVFNAAIITDNAFIAIVYWNTDNSTVPYYAEERHGLVMDGETHSYLHTVLGARYISGGALQNFDVDGTGNLASNAQFTSDSGSIRDEDILHQYLAQTQIPILYRIGTLWRKKAADAYPVIYSGTAGYTGANGRLPYNELVAGSWQLTEVSNNQFVLVHVFATNDINNPVVGIQGIATYNDISSARTGAIQEITTLAGLPFAEFVTLGSVIFETANTYGNVPKARIRSTGTGANYVDFRGTQPYTPAAGVATSHSLLSNLSSDDHLQYLTDARGDARYYTQSQTNTLLATKQDTLGFTPENVANKATNLTSPDNTKYPTTLAVSTGLGAKQDTLVSGTNIKTINGSSILGSGNLVISGGGGLGDSFETVSKNLKAYNYSLTYSSGILTTMTYSLGGSSYVYKTFNYNLDGTLASIVLSGSIPSGITTTKTLTYSGGNLSSIAYT